MPFTPASRDWTMVKVPTKAAVTYAVGDMVYNDGTNNVIVATTTQGNIIGIVQEAKDSSATTTDISVLCPTSVFSTFYGDASGTLTKAIEGQQFDFADNNSIAQASSTYDAVILHKFIDASNGVFRLNYTFGVEN